MALREPAPGLVIRYAYLWRAEAMRGQREGRKDRPCVVVLAAVRQDNHLFVTVAPITHAVPEGEGGGVEIPAATKQRLGLDERRSWILSTEVNWFAWPGPDLRPVSSRKRDVFAYGFIPGRLLAALRQQIVANGRISVTHR